MALMRPFTFSLMLLLQRADEALRAERQRSVRTTSRINLLLRRRSRLADRLRRSFPTPLAGG
jgi:hypothetical protein